MKESTLAAIRRSGTLAACLGLAVVAMAETPAFGSGKQQTIAGRIVPGVGVGKLRLGMSAQAARRVLAPLGSRRFVRRVEAGTAREYVEHEYPNPTIRWDLIAAYTVGLRGPPGKRRVAVIEVHVPENRTRGSLGVGSLERQLLRAYPNLFRMDFAALEQTRREYRLGARWRRHTVFVVKFAGLAPGNRHRPPRVSRVMLREPGVPLG